MQKNLLTTGKTFEPHSFNITTFKDINDIIQLLFDTDKVIYRGHFAAISMNCHCFDMCNKYTETEFC